MAADNFPFRVYTYHHFTDAEILHQAEEDIRAGAASFYFLYLSEMDMFLHMNCTQPDQIEQRLRWYDSGLRNVFQAAGQADRSAIFTIVSDHGMTPVSQHYDLLQQIDQLKFRMPDDYLAVYDSTMARYWFFDERARREIVNILQNLPCGRVLSETELQRLGVSFSDRRYGEAVFLLDPGWLFSKSDFSGVSWKPSGMHGYHPSDPYSDAVYLSNRKPAVPLQSVQDAYGCMLEGIRRGGS
jgi:predicted AlkP superfamily pyrophosphatase or phosphodiesterase